MCTYCKKNIILCFILRHQVTVSKFRFIFQVPGCEISTRQTLSQRFVWELEYKLSVFSKVSHALLSGENHGSSSPDHNQVLWWVYPRLNITALQLHLCAEGQWCANKYMGLANECALGLKGKSKERLGDTHSDSSVKREARVAEL